MIAKIYSNIKSQIVYIQMWYHIKTQDLDFAIICTNLKEQLQTENTCLKNP